MWIVQVALRRPYTFIVMALMILLATPLALMRMPTDVFPDVDIPVVSIIWNYSGLPAQEIDAVLGIMCPNTLLPYAREAVASLMTRAGFPPVLLQHMNFEAAYQERLRQLQQEQAAQAAAPQSAPN